MFRSILRSLRPTPNDRLSKSAIEENERDLKGVPELDPGIEPVISATIDWLKAAQDNSTSNDNGVARDFSLISGWNSSYPETTGYIIPTFLRLARLRNDDELRSRAKRMLDWLVSIQFADGGFQGSVIGALPEVPVTFNTGQILLGLAAGTREFGEEYREPMRRAANWLVSTQDVDGCWRRHRSPFAEATDKAYETHVSWGLLEAASVDGDERFANAAISNINWALSNQTENGWFKNCCLSEASRPLTHTLGYVLRGIIEAYLFTKDARYLESSQRTANALLEQLRPDGSLPGRLDEQWRGKVDWSCLTGNVQISACWFILHELTGEKKYLVAAQQANSFVRRTIALDGPPEIRGGVKGSFPVSGDYCRYEYPNWAAKFLLDALMMEQQLS